MLLKIVHRHMLFDVHWQVTPPPDMFVTHSLFGCLACSLVVWPAVWLPGLQVGCLACRLVAWPAGWLPGLQVGCLQKQANKTTSCFGLLRQAHFPLRFRRVVLKK